MLSAWFWRSLGVPQGALRLASRVASRENHGWKGVVPAGPARKLRGAWGVPSCIYYKEMTAVDEDDIIPLVTFTLLLLSEILPFVGQTDGNGMLHTLFRVIAKIVNSSRQHLLGAHKPVVVPTLDTN